MMTSKRLVMAIKPFAIATGLILFCFWFLTQHSARKGYERIPTGTVEDLHKKYPYTSLNKVRGKVGRALWDAIEPAFKCPEGHLTRVGRKGDGGKYVCGLTRLGAFYEQTPGYSCVLYSFGVNQDSSFEAEVLTNTRCSLYAYDPKVSRIGPPLKSSNPRVHFFKKGLGGINVHGQKTLKTLMEDNGGHHWIDILKIDVEGHEYASLNAVLRDFDELPFGQLLVELHHNGKNMTAVREKIMLLIRNLELRGLRMFSKEVNEVVPKTCSEFSFINVRALDRFIMQGITQ